MASLKIRLRSSRIKKNGESPLFIQIFSGKTKQEISLGLSVKSEDWDAAKQQIKRRNPRNGQLNALIRSSLNEMQDIIYQLQKDKAYFTASDIVHSYRNKPVFKKAENSVITTYLQDYVDRNPDSLKKSTLLTYGIFINCFSVFKPNLTFDKLELNLVKEYDKYLRRKKLAVNTISNRMKILRKTIGLAIQDGLLKNNPMLGYKRRRKEGNIEYLTKEEIELIEGYKASTPQKQKVIDLFLFRSYCGLRVSDQLTLKNSNVKEVDGDIYLDLEMNKVRTRVSFKLTDKAKGIFEKYNNPKAKYLFEVLNENKDLDNETVLLREINKKTSYFNKVTKEMAEILEINKTVTSHVARHSYATISLSISIPIEVVSNLLGHKSIKETQIYAKVLDTNKDKAIDLWNKL